jgi:hypothetical protein
MAMAMAKVRVWGTLMARVRVRASGLGIRR